ncbi:O-antigen ligase family protein [Anaeromyxobacter soli]|uniref:O-antigen ligase family protein n=1 Tax=Anaeromyxobacter soli TaxID=2922725 RepID=UPI001FB02C72|nr:O-antigen ligase family protein [Anaeromyxobacter sp. SG29]
MTAEVPGIGGRWALAFLAAFCAIVVFAPPLPIDFEFASRGVKLDQVLLLPLVYLTVRRDPDAASVAVSNPAMRPLWWFAGFSLVSALWSLIFAPGLSVGGALAGAWGTFRLPFVMLLGLTAGARVTDTQRRSFSWFLAFLTVLMAGVATAQLFKWEPIYGFLSANYTRKADFDLVLEALDLGRAYGTFDGQPNVLGSFGVLGVAVIGSLLVEADRSRARLLLAGATFAATWLIAISWSRGAYAGALTVLMYLLWRAGRRRLLGFVVAGTVVLVGLYSVLPEVPLERLMQLMEARGDGSGESIFESRLPFWQTNWELFTQNPLFGLRSADSAPLDNLYLGLLLVHGLAGTIVFAFACLRFLRLLRSLESPGARVLGMACSATTLGWLVNGLSVPSFFGERVQELFFVVMGVALAAPELAVGRDDALSTKSSDSPVSAPELP